MKVCKHHGELTEAQIYNKPNVSYTVCRLCINAGRKKYTAANREKIRAQEKIYRQKESYKEKLLLKRKRYKEKQAEHNKKWYEANKNDPKRRQNNINRAMASERNAIDELKDSYVKRVICKRTKLKPKDIPEEMVELKRTVLKVNRILKEIKK